MGRPHPRKEEVVPPVTCTQGWWAPGGAGRWEGRDGGWQALGKEGHPGWTPGVWAGERAGTRHLGPRGRGLALRPTGNGEGH